MIIQTAKDIAEDYIYDDFIVEEWEDGEIVNDYQIVKKSGLGSVRKAHFGNDGNFCDTWVVQTKGKYYPAKIVRNSISNKVQVRVYRKDGTRDLDKAYKKCLAYHNELILKVK